MSTQFDPSSVGTLRDLEIGSLAALPNTEDDTFEYKGSKTSDGDLIGKIERAASAFWNSGGGFLVAGVDRAGKPDGGIGPQVGRQSRLDWTDQVLARVMPRGVSQSTFLTGSPAQGGLEGDKGVLVIGFQVSGVAPHMAPDGRYYIRAGAHTTPASHFIVEAIRARRGVTAPVLAFFLRRKPEVPYFADLEFVNHSSVPAIGLTVRLAPPPPLLQRIRSSGEIHFRVVTEAHPARIPFTFFSQGVNDWGQVDVYYQMFLEYSDPLGRSYKEEHRFLPREDLPKPLGDQPALERIALALAQIAAKLGPGARFL